MPDWAEVPPAFQEELAGLRGASVTHFEVALAALRRPNPLALFALRDSAAFCRELPAALARQWEDEAQDKRQVGCILSLRKPGNRNDATEPAR